MASRNTVPPRFPNPPKEYDQRYLADVLRAFALYQQQVMNAGDGRFTTIVLTNLPTNAAGTRKIVP